jgi:hypothetical protein
MNIDQLPSSWKGHKEFAHWLPNWLKPQLTVELGVDQGYSLLCLARNNPGKVIGIDTFQGDKQAGVRDPVELYNAVAARCTQFDNIQLIQDTFNNVVKNWNQTIDILHIDGAHDYNSVQEDFYQWSPFVKVTGVILLHDVYAWPDGPGRLFKEIIAKNIPGMQSGLFPHSAGLGVFTMNLDLHRSLMTGFPDLYIHQANYYKMNDPAFIKWTQEN